jgi:hypothetical protein
MSITLQIGMTEIALPDSLCWVDEFDWTPIAQGLSYTESGHLIVEESARQAGQPITLAGDWISRSEILTLRSHQTTASADPMTLTLHDSSSHSVVWRRDGVQPLSAVPIRGEIANPNAAEQYALTLRFIKV